MESIFVLYVGPIMLTLKPAGKIMSPGGSVVLVGSIADVRSPRGYGAYGAIRVAVLGSVRIGANDLCQMFYYHRACAEVTGRSVL